MSPVLPAGVTPSGGPSAHIHSKCVPSSGYRLQAALQQMQPSSPLESRLQAVPRCNPDRLKAVLQLVSSLALSEKPWRSSPSMQY